MYIRALDSRAIKSVERSAFRQKGRGWKGGGGEGREAKARTSEQLKMVAPSHRPSSGCPQKTHTPAHAENKGRRGCYSCMQRGQVFSASNLRRARSYPARRALSLPPPAALSARENERNAREMICPRCVASPSAVRAKWKISTAI